MKSDSLLIMDDPSLGLVVGRTTSHSTNNCGGKHDKGFLIPTDFFFFYDLRKEKRNNTWSIQVEKGQNALIGVSLP